jgi:hypothetical protein
MEDIHEIPNTVATEDQIKNEDKENTQNILFTKYNLNN